MHAYRPIDCGDYDFIEIACMDRYELRVTTDDGTILGKAKTVGKQADGEYLRLTSDRGDALDIRLDRIVRLDVLTTPRRFATHDFVRPDTTPG